MTTMMQWTVLLVLWPLLTYGLVAAVRRYDRWLTRRAQRRDVLARLKAYAEHDALFPWATR